MDVDQPLTEKRPPQSGFSTLLFLFPKDNIVVAVMTNMDGSAVRDPFARKVAQIAATATD
jgi:hypothetical protein